MRPAFLLTIHFACMGVGCATLATPMPSAGRDAPVMHIVRVGQFIFTTDFAIHPEDAWIVDLVNLRDSLFRTLELPSNRDPVRIVIFENRQRYEEFLRLNFPELPSRRAFFLRQGENDLVVFACQGEQLQTDLRHEVTHALLHSALPQPPLWLDEGLAEYFEHWSDPGGRHPDHVARLHMDVQEPGQLSLARLEGLTDFRRMQPADYREAWLWTHYLLHHSAATRQTLLGVVGLLREGKPARVSALIQAPENDPHAVFAHLKTLAAPPALADAPREPRR